jgi:hypothetical protein
MKLKELFDKYSFDEILPYLKIQIPDHLDSIPAFREAFDELKHMEPSNEDCGETLIQGYLDEEGNLYEDSLNCHYLGDEWNACLAKNVVVECDVEIDECLILASCLWEMTFFGFSSELNEEDDCTFQIPEQPKNKYDEALYKLRLSNWKHSTPRKYRSKLFALCTDSEFAKQRRNKKNRIKRLREHRIERRERYLEMHSQREEFIKKLVNCGAFKRDQVEYLHQVESGQYYHYVSRTWDGHNRIDYILDSINKYQSIDFSQYNDAIICLRTSSEHLLMEIERMKLMAELPEPLLEMPVKMRAGINKSIGNEVEMMLFLNVTNSTK